MSKTDGFLTIPRTDPPLRKIRSRIADFKDVKSSLSDDQVSNQALRCLDCGIPFCHMYGCPLGNRIPDYTDAITKGHWREALELLHSTNNFPEITGRVCPALCEAACTLSVNFSPSLCQHIELRIVEHGWSKGWIIPEPPQVQSGYRVAVVGSGPSGLTVAQQLRRTGHNVVVFEKAQHPGGIPMYGIPNFKLEKWIIERRVDQMRKEGVIFETEVTVGSDISAHYLAQRFDAIVLATGTPVPRDLSVPGRSAQGICFALDFLTQQTNLVLGNPPPEKQLINPKDKHVVIIGGGDTGSDCVGTVLRRGCASVMQLELLPKPSSERQPDNPWPQWPKILRTSSSHKEGGERLWSVKTTSFIQKNHMLTGVNCTRVRWKDGTFIEIPGTESIIKADLVLLSMGFLKSNLTTLPIEFCKQNASQENNREMEQPGIHQKVFITGDAAMGPSLVVHAINSGRICAERVNDFLKTK